MSKKSCIIFGNCQGGGVKKFLEFSNFYDIYNVKLYANWEMIKHNESIPIRYLQNADLVIYQPLSDVHNCYSTNKNNPESFFNVLKDTCNTIAFPIIHIMQYFLYLESEKKEMKYMGVLKIMHHM